MTTAKTKMVWLCSEGNIPRRRLQMASLPRSRPPRAPMAICCTRSRGINTSCPPMMPTATVVSM